MESQASTPKRIRELLDKTLDLPVPALSAEEFERVFGFRASPSEIQGMTYAEAMIRQLVFRASIGNDKSIQEVLDRLLGKPMQTSEAVVKNITYNDFLIRCYEEDKKIIPAEIVESPPPAPRDPLLDLL